MGIYLASEQDITTEGRSLILCGDDYVVDSSGVSYVLSNTLTLIKTERVLAVDHVTNLIRANAFQRSELCLTKIHFLTVADAIKSLLYWGE